MTKKIWIEPGCIVCYACEEACPEVFEVHEEGSQVLENYLLEDQQKLLDAVQGCPVEVIKIDTGMEK